MTWCLLIASAWVLAPIALCGLLLWAVRRADRHVRGSWNP